MLYVFQIIVWHQKHTATNINEQLFHVGFPWQQIFFRFYCQLSWQEARKTGRKAIQH